MSMISNFNNLRLEKSVLVAKCAAYKAKLTLSLSSNVKRGFQWFKSRTSSQGFTEKKFGKEKCTFLMINVTYSTIKLTLASVVTLNNFSSL